MSVGIGLVQLKWRALSAFTLPVLKLLLSGNPSKPSLLCMCVCEVPISIDFSLLWWLVVHFKLDTVSLCEAQLLCISSLALCVGAKLGCSVVTGPFLTVTQHSSTCTCCCAQGDVALLHSAVPVHSDHALCCFGPCHGRAGHPGALPSVCLCLHAVALV